MKQWNRKIENFASELLEILETLKFAGKTLIIWNLLDFNNRKRISDKKL